MIVSAQPNRTSKRSGSVELRSLRQTLAYRNDVVVHKFRESYDVSVKDAKELFDETKRFLWLCARSIQTEGPRIIVGEEFLMLDEMWHTFVLFTADYADFCRQYFGIFINHRPTTKKEKEAALAAFVARPSRQQRHYYAKLEQMMEFIHVELGANVLHRWFVELPERYTLERINVLRKPIRIHDQSWRELLASRKR